MSELTSKVSILDHGSLGLVESWGSDQAIIAAARMSTSGSFRGWGPVTKCLNCGVRFDAPETPCPKPSGTRPLIDCGRGGHYFVDEPGDEKLLAYLWTHRHSTPFETPGMTIEVCCPVVVVWQWVRHRTLSFNILSGRYAEMPEDDYLPTVERLMVSDDGNRQAGAARGASALTEETANEWLAALARVYGEVDAVYQHGLRIGVPKEIARLPLGFARYTRMRVTGNLWNWTRFLSLRMDGHAQQEIRLYANAVGDLIAKAFPRTWAIFSAR